MDGPDAEASDCTPTAAGLPETVVRAETERSQAWEVAWVEDAGAVYLLEVSGDEEDGGLNLWSTDGGMERRWQAVPEGEGYVWRLAVGGDLDEDGAADVTLSYVDSGTDPATFAVLIGSVGTPPTLDAAWRIEDVADVRFGAALAYVDDGLLAVGAPDQGSGAAHVFAADGAPGVRGVEDATATWTSALEDHELAGEWLGTVEEADGTRTLLVASARSTYRVVAAVVAAGGSLADVDRVDAAPGWGFRGPADVGDLDGDGDHEWAVAAGEDVAGTGDTVRVFSGVAPMAVVIDDETVRSGLGYAVAGVPDVDGDGRDELLLTAQDVYRNPGTSGAYLVMGPPCGLIDVATNPGVVRVVRTDEEVVGLAASAPDGSVAVDRGPSPWDVETRAWEIWAW